MRVLLIGGNRLIGLDLAFRLLSGGHQVTVLNRGTQEDPLGARVERLRADRGTDAFDAVLAGRTFDVVVDFALFDGAQAERLVRVLGGKAGHFVVISTGQVYLVREGLTAPYREVDAPGPLMAAPPTPADEEDWRYGVDKRAAELVLEASGLPVSVLRIPMVHGARDYRRRVESLLWRFFDGGPLLLARPEAVCRHVASSAVARVAAQLVEAPRAGVWNLTTPDSLTARSLVAQLQRLTGARNVILTPTPEALAAAGLSATLACPFSSRWMSVLDPAKAVAELGFVHEPYVALLPTLVEAAMGRLSAEPPPSYAQRPAELAFAARQVSTTPLQTPTH
jgi:nucleoside-diphosphate-sugar epimerase